MTHRDLREAGFARQGRQIDGERVRQASEVDSGRFGRGLRTRKDATRPVEVALRGGGGLAYAADGAIQADLGAGLALKGGKVALSVSKAFTASSPLALSDDAVTAPLRLERQSIRLDPAADPGEPVFATIADADAWCTLLRANLQSAGFME